MKDEQGMARTVVMMVVRELTEAEMAEDILRFVERLVSQAVCSRQL